MQNELARMSLSGERLQKGDVIGQQQFLAGANLDNDFTAGAGGAMSRGGAACV